jgi:hypothetical protein
LVLRQKLPPTASVVHKTSLGKLHSPAAQRNVGDIIRVVCEYSPKSGNALEIASGTGQHIVELAAAVSSLIWQPSDVDPTRLVSIAVRSSEKQLANILPPINLDVTTSAWADLCPKQDFVLLVNLLHLVSNGEVELIIAGIAQSLNPRGRCIIYGPFMRNGVLTSGGDEDFHRSLIETDPEIGYKDDQWILGLFQKQNLQTIKVIEMPANNLAFIVGKGTTK